MTSKSECPVCGAVLEQTPRKLCRTCGNGDRTRTLFLVYRTIKTILSERRALVFTEENWLDPCLFHSCEKSVYLGKNHLDIQNISRSDESYDWIASNHVLEHVPNDGLALQEMYRILSPYGILQLTIPTPGKVYHTKDWGFPDETKMGHYRNYGAEFQLFLRNLIPDAWLVSAFARDSITDFADIVYFIAKNESTATMLASQLLLGKVIAVPSAPINA